MMDKILQLLKAGKIKEAIDLLANDRTGDEHPIILSSLFSFVDEQRRRGEISTEEFRIEMTKLVGKVLSFIKEDKGEPCESKSQILVFVFLI